jgi:signal transduction histidine kinase
MIADVLDVSRIEAGIQQVDLVPMHLCNVVRECVAQLAPAAAAKRLTMEAICRDPDVVVRIDHDKFTQIITNLLDNAVKFTPRDGSVTVAAGRDEAGRAYVTVTDTGEGIPPESLDRLFQRFYQAGQKLSARKQGLGLGLYLVKSLIELQHGTISVTSELGKGSEFRITLPIHAQGPASPGTGDGRLE